MNTQTRTSIVQRLTKLTQNVGEPFQEVHGRTRHIMSEGTAFSLSNDFLDIFEDVTRSLLQDESWGEKFSEKYVDGLLQKVLAKALRDGNPDKIGTYVDEIIKQFESFSQERIVYVPLDGIQMSIEELPIGKVVLKKMTDSNISVLLNEVERTLQSIKNPPE
jgi:hypothetical protein